jgi:hypothetical protein
VTFSTGCGQSSCSRKVGPAELYPDAAPDIDPKARPVQPGFKDAPPGMVPEMKEDPGPELREEPGGRFAKQLASLPEKREEDDLARPGTPGPRNPTPLPPTEPDGHVAIPSVGDKMAGALNPAPPIPPANTASADGTPSGVRESAERRDADLA